MMRTELIIRNIVPAHSHGAYTLYLKEKNGNRILPIIIGGFEAQAIAMELEKMKPSRPLTHDLFANTLEEYSIKIVEISIDRLEEGVYYASIICVDFKTPGAPRIKLDSRTSDAIAMATKFHCPIFCNEGILSESAYNENADDEMDFDAPGRADAPDVNPVAKVGNDLARFNLEELEQMLEEAINIEDYSRAAQLRDEINRRK